MNKMISRSMSDSPTMKLIQILELSMTIAARSIYYSSLELKETELQLDICINKFPCNQSICCVVNN